MEEIVLSLVVVVVGLVGEIGRRSLLGRRLDREMHGFVLISLPTDARRGGLAQ
jgi:hypothetical protein